MFTYLEQIMNGANGGNRAGAFTSVGNFVMAIANIFIVVALGLSFISIALSFVQFVTSAGDPKMVERAERGILWGGIGFVLSLIAFSLKNILVKMAGL
jgi:hypothetical protein